MTPYQLPPLPYAYDALEPWCDARTLELHHDAHHRAYVDGANAATEALAEVDPENVHLAAGLRADLTFQLGGHVLHSLFWENLSPDTPPPPTGLRGTLEDQFGSYERFTDLFTRACVSVKGSGWGALALDPINGGLSILAIRDHHVDLVPSSALLAVVDVWEHAYYLTYQQRRVHWVEAAVQHLNWPIIAQRHDAALDELRIGQREGV